MDSIQVLRRIEERLTDLAGSERQEITQKIRFSVIGENTGWEIVSKKIENGYEPQKLNHPLFFI